MVIELEAELSLNRHALLDAAPVDTRSPQMELAVDIFNWSMQRIDRALRRKCRRPPTRE